MLSGLVAEFLAETPPLVHELRAAAAGGDPARPQPSNVAPQSGDFTGKGCP